MQNVANRRQFFENYAEENGFDPLNPKNWYAQPTEKIMAVKVLLENLCYFSFFIFHFSFFIFHFSFFIFHFSSYKFYFYNY
jgi:hypothetical protein